MIDRRVVAAWLPGNWFGVEDGQPVAGASRGWLVRALASPGRAAVNAVPWGWADAGAALLWTVALVSGGFLGLFGLAAVLVVLCTIGTLTHLLPQHLVDSAIAGVAPYQVAATTLVLGTLLYGSLLYAVYRTSIKKYGLSWYWLYVRPTSGRTYGRVAALFFPVILLGMLVTRLQVLLTGLPIQNPQAALLTRGMPTTPANFLLVALLLVAIAPVVEELVFRAFLYRLLCKRLPAWAAACVSAALFAGAHGIPSLMPWLFFMGLVYTVIVHRTKSVGCGMLLHAMVNALATLGIIVSLTIN